MPLDTVLCLDTSGSMANRGIQELKRAANQFLDGIEETAKQSQLKVCNINSVQLISHDYNRISFSSKIRSCLKKISVKPSHFRNPG